MAKRLPAFQFYPTDFVCATMHMDLRQVGLYALRLFGAINHSGDPTVEELFDSWWGGIILRKNSKVGWFVRLDVTVQEWRNIRNVIISRDGTVCTYCRKRAGVVHVDHMIPVSRGGTTAHGNLCVSCKKCNTRKSNMTPLEFVATKEGWFCG